MGFADDIKLLRQAALLSQESFAKELGVSFATVNRWETGKTLPSYKAMKNIKEFCESLDMVFDVEKYMKQCEGNIHESREK